MLLIKISHENFPKEKKRQLRTFEPSPTKINDSINQPLMMRKNCLPAQSTQVFTQTLTNTHKKSERISFDIKEEEMSLAISLFQTSVGVDVAAVNVVLALCSRLVVD